MRNKYFCLCFLSVLSFSSFNADAARLSVLFSGSSSGGVTFAGYAGPFDGNLGNLKGANSKCATAFSGSHVCTYEEIVKLGANYPYTNNIWFFGAINAIDSGGFYAATGTGTANSGNGTCFGWANAVATNYGFILSTAGTTTTAQCSTTQYLACCQ